MKATLLFATTLSMLLSGSGAMGMTELEALRARCSQQEQQIQSLERQLHGGANEKVATQAKPAAETTTAAADTHVVRAGESLERIARRNGCSASQLAKLNGLRGNAVIHPGQKLKLPNAAKASAPAAPVAQTAKPEVSRYAGKTHTVRQGETYYSISKKYRMSMNTLMSANPGIKATSLRPGLVLKLSNGSSPKPESTAPASAPMIAAKPSYPEAKTTPVVAMKSSAPQPLNEVKPSTRSIPVTAETPRGLQKASATPASAPQTPAPAPVAAAKEPVSAPAAQAPQPAPAPQPVAQTQEAPAPAAQAPLSSTPNPEKKVRSVTVDNEMTYGDFATSHGTDTARLNDLNGLDLTHATVLAKGSELYVPAQP